MRTITLWICGKMPDYTIKLMEYLNRQRNSPFIVHVSSEPENLPHDKAGEDLLLIDSDLFNGQEGFKNFSTIILMDEGNVKKELIHFPCIFKYQPAKAIYNALLEIFLERENVVEPVHRNKDSYVVGVYSPAGRICKTEFSRMFGKREGFGKRLYINLELFPQKVQTTGISDILYYFRQQRGNLSRKIELTAESTDSFYALEGTSCPWDLWDVPVEEWMNFFQQLKMEGYYNLIVADIGYLPQNPEFFRCFDKVYIPYIQDDKVLGKVMAFEALLNFIEFDNREKLFERIELQQYKGGVVDDDIL